MKFVAEYATEKASQLGKEVKFACTTNATLLTEEHLRFTQQYGFLYLLSIDGVKEVHDKYRVKANGQGSFDDIMKKLPMLKRLQGWLGTRMTVNPDTVHRLSESVQALFEMGINQFLIGVNTDVPWSKEAMRTYAREMRKVWEFYQQKKREREHLFASLILMRLWKNGEIGCAQFGDVMLDEQGWLSLQMANSTLVLGLSALTLKLTENIA